MFAYVAKDGQRVALQDLFHENSDHVSIQVAGILALAIDVMRPENGRLNPNHPRRGQIQFHRKLGHAVGVGGTGARVSVIGGGNFP